MPGLEVAAHYHIASPDEVGGDFYDLFPLADGTLGRSSSATCAARAPTAAAVTSLARYTLRAAARLRPRPGRACSANLNTVLHQRVPAATTRASAPSSSALLTARRRTAFRVTLASGGHPPALLLRADGTADYLPTPGGQLVGVLPDAHFATATVRLAPGDTLLLYTDGLTEARTAATARDATATRRCSTSPAPSRPTTAPAAVAALQRPARHLRRRRGRRHGRPRHQRAPPRRRESGTRERAPGSRGQHEPEDASASGGRLKFQPAAVALGDPGRALAKTRARDRIPAVITAYDTGWSGPSRSPLAGSPPAGPRLDAPQGWRGLTRAPDGACALGHIASS